MERRGKSLIIAELADAMSDAQITTDLFANGDPKITFSAGQSAAIEGALAQRAFNEIVYGSQSSLDITLEQQVTDPCLRAWDVDPEIVIPRVNL